MEVNIFENFEKLISKTLQFCLYNTPPLPNSILNSNVYYKKVQFCGVFLTFPRILNKTHRVYHIMHHLSTQRILNNIQICCIQQQNTIYRFRIQNCFEPKFTLRSNFQMKLGGWEREGVGGTVQNLFNITKK